MNDQSEYSIKSNVYSKWGDVALGGFQAVPDLLLRRQHELHLTSTDLVVLLNVLMHWWYADCPPFPRPTAIANRMGLNVRSVQRSVKDLETLGLIRRGHDVRGNAVLDPTGLVVKLREFAETDVHFLARRERMRESGAPEARSA